MDHPKVLKTRHFVWSAGLPGFIVKLPIRQVVDIVAFISVGRRLWNEAPDASYHSSQDDCMGGGLKDI